MAESHAILIVGEGIRSKRIAETAYNLGFIPLMKDEMNEALDTLCHEQFVAVFVDGETIGADSIEFLLNVRDIDARIPVVVLDEHLARTESEVLQRQYQTYLLPDAGLAAALLERIL